MDEPIKQEITLQGPNREFDAVIRVHALEQAVRWLAPVANLAVAAGTTASGKDVINVAKKFEAYLRNGE